MRKFEWSVALRSGPLERLETFVADAEAAGAAALHADVADGRFQRTFGLGADTIAAVQRVSSLPVHLHAQVEAADTLLPTLLAMECNAVTLQIESLTHAHRALSQIREQGMRAGLALCAGTPLTALEHLLPTVDRVLVLTSDPGQREKDLTRAVFERVKILRENLDFQNHRVELGVKGVRSAEDAARLIEHGADHLVIDDAALLMKSDLRAALADFAEDIGAHRHVA